MTRRTITWDEDWIHLNIGESLNKDILKNEVNIHFQSFEKLYLKRGRNNSSELLLKNTIETLGQLIGKEDFELWRTDLKAAIKFSRYGLMLKSKNAI